MQKFSEVAYPLARAFLGLLFLISGIAKIAGFAGYVVYMGKAGLPMAEVLLVLTIAVEVGCGLSLITGWKSFYAAIILAIFLIPTTAVFHAFWNAEGAAFSNQLTNFLKNLSILGGMLLLIEREQPAFKRK